MDSSPGGSGATAPLQPALAPWRGRERGESEARGGRERGDALATAGEREARGGRERLTCGSAWKKREKELKDEGKKGKEKM